MIRTRLFETVARLACRSPRAVLGVALGLTLLSWIPPLAVGVGFAFSIARMLPQDVPAARAFTRAVTDFGAADEAVVVFHLRESSDAAIRVAGRAADRAAAALRTDPDIRSAFCRRLRPEEKEYLLEALLPRWGLLLLPDAKIHEAATRLEPARIRRSVRRTARRMRSAMTDARLERLAALDALDLGALFHEAAAEIGAELDEEAATGYLVDPGRTMLLLVIQPRRPAQRAEFAQAIMQRIRGAVDDALAAETPAGRALFEVEYGGGYEIATRYTDRVHRTLLVTLATSLLGVILLFGWCFRRPGVLLYIGVPLAMVVSWTVGLGWIVFGQLNLISCAFAAVLVGLGVDYAIHIYNRYAEERVGGVSVEEAFRRSLVHTGWGVFVGMATTCLAFLALKATRFTQLGQFGFLAGLGIALSVPAMLFVLPALIAMRNARHPEHARALRPTRFGLPRLADALEARRRGIVVVGLLLAAAGLGYAVLAPGALRFDARVSSLRPRERAFELGGEIARAFSNRNPNKLLLLTSAQREVEAVEAAARAAEVCEELEAEGKLLDYETVMRLLPAPGVQERRLALLRTIDFAAAREALLSSLEREGLYPEAFDLSLRLLEEHARTAAAGEPLLPSTLEQTPLWRLLGRLVTRRKAQYFLGEELPPSGRYPVTLARPAVRRDGEELFPAGARLTREQVESMRETVKSIRVLAPGWTVKTNLYPPIDPASRTADLQISDAWLDDVRARLGADANGAGAVTLTGIAILAHELAGVVRADFLRISVYVLGAAALALAFFFHRHPARVVYCLTPILLGLAYLIGAMAVLRLPFNFVNVLAVPIIIGLGVDNGIHLVNRFYEARRRIRPMVSDTGRAIVITTLTSMIGFGSLAVGGYAAITSMGILSILALGANLVASLVVFPALLATLSPPREAPADPEADLD